MTASFAGEGRTWPPVLLDSVAGGSQQKADPDRTCPPHAVGWIGPDGSTSGD